MRTTILRTSNFSVTGIKKVLASLKTTSKVSKEYVLHNIIKYSENTDTVIEVEKSCALNTTAPQHSN